MIINFKFLQYNLDYKCTLPTEKQNATSIDPMKHCTVEDIPKIVMLSVMDDDNNSSSQGKFKALFIDVNT